MGSSALYDGSLLTDLSDDDSLTRTIPPDRRFPSDHSARRYNEPRSETATVAPRRPQSVPVHPYRSAGTASDKTIGRICMNMPPRMRTNTMATAYHIIDVPITVAAPVFRIAIFLRRNRRIETLQETDPRLRRTAAAVENIPRGHRAIEKHNLHSKTRRGVRFPGHLSVFYVSAAIAAGPLKKRTIFLPPDGRHPAVYSAESAVGTAACSSTIAPGSSPLRCLARKRSIVR